ncbi:MAG: type II toxin-antitoxin system HicB family antitoxin [Candidatus Pristimantibacillus sp.]
MNNFNEEVEFTVMYEEDKAEGNVSAYIPALRLGVSGDTLEEARENAKDLIAMELQKAQKQKRSLPPETSIIEKIKVNALVIQ